jgi:hypothetical protein
MQNHKTITRVNDFKRISTYYLIDSLQSKIENIETEDHVICIEKFKMLMSRIVARRDADMKTRC